jgi:hypothetical protein
MTVGGRVGHAQFRPPEAVFIDARNNRRETRRDGENPSYPPFRQREEFNKNTTGKSLLPALLIVSKACFLPKGGRAEKDFIVARKDKRESVAARAV